MHKREKVMVQSNWMGGVATVEYWRIDAHTFALRSKDLVDNGIFLLEAVCREPILGEKSFGYSVKCGDSYGEGKDLVVVHSAFFIETERPDFAVAWTQNGILEREVNCEKGGNRIKALVTAVAEVLFNIY